VDSTTDRVVCNLKSVRRAKGFSQSELARLAGVKRQAIYDMESGRYVPNTAVALRLAKHLGCRVEDLFSVEEEDIEQPITLVGEGSAGASRLSIVRVRGRLVGYPLGGSVMLSDGLQAADGLIRPDGGGIRLLEREDRLEKTALLLGCDPAFTILSSHVARCAGDARVQCRFSSSIKALEAVASGVAHIAGTHLHNVGRDESNISTAQRLLPDANPMVLAFSSFEEGLMVAPGNPLGIRSVADLAREGVRFINREEGAALRVLLDEHLARAGIPAEAVSGYHNLALNHVHGAQAVVFNLADAALGLRAIAAAYDLDFVPIESVRCDLVIPCDLLDHAAVRVILDVLQTRALRHELASLPGYDSSCMGKTIHSG
jgi:putative molybdopterin biosynthesis protein